MIPAYLLHDGSMKNATHSFSWKATPGWQRAELGAGSIDFQNRLATAADSNAAALTHAWGNICATINATLTGTAGWRMCPGCSQRSA